MRSVTERRWKLRQPVLGEREKGLHLIKHLLCAVYCGRCLKYGSSFDFRNYCKNVE